MNLKLFFFSFKIDSVFCFNTLSFTSRYSIFRQKKKLLLRQKIKIKFKLKMEERNKQFVQAARDGDLELVKNLLKKGVDVNYKVCF